MSACTRLGWRMPAAAAGVRGPHAPGRDQHRSTGAAADRDRISCRLGTRAGNPGSASAERRDPGVSCRRTGLEVVGATDDAVAATGIVHGRRSGGIRPEVKLRCRCPQSPSPTVTVSNHLNRLHGSRSPVDAGQQNAFRVPAVFTPGLTTGQCGSRCFRASRGRGA